VAGGKGSVISCVKENDIIVSFLRRSDPAEERRRPDRPGGTKFERYGIGRALTLR
jgi:hypothetical protein